MNIFKYCLILSLMIFGNNIFAQEIQWQNTIGGINRDNLGSIHQTMDGGFIFGGSSMSDISGDKTENSKGYEDYWVIKTDNVGNILWQKTIGGNNHEYGPTVCETADGGYLLGGISSSNISGDKTEDSMGGDDYWIVKIDSIGNILWQNTIGGSGSDWLQTINLTPDGGFLLGGYSTSNISGDKSENSFGGADYWVVKIDSLGLIQWQKTIGGMSGDVLTSVLNTTDGGYVLAGYSNSGISGLKTENSNGMNDYWIVKIDPTGNIHWQNSVGGNLDDKCFAIKSTSDSGYIIGGYSKSDAAGDKTEGCFGMNDYWVLKIDSIGTIQWQSTIGGNSEDFLCDIAYADDNGYLLAGYSQSGISGVKTVPSNGGQDYWLIEIDSIGNVRWQKNIGGMWADHLFRIERTTDGEYVLGGNSASGISGDKTEICQGNYDYWVIKICNSPILEMDVETCGEYLSPSGNFIWNSSGLYTDYIVNPNGCDTVISINLTINNNFLSIAATGSTTFCQGDSVMLSANPGLLNYQWYRRNFAIPGATSINYIAKSGGRYSCIAQNAILCSDTSNFIVVNVPCVPIGPNQDRSVSINEFELPIFQISPNPGNGIFTIQSPPGLIKIFNSSGQMILSSEIFDELSSFDISEYSDGIYFVMHRTGETIHSQKIIMAR